jgi:hypothetical protein
MACHLKVNTIDLYHKVVCITYQNVSKYDTKTASKLFESVALTYLQDFV